MCPLESASNVITSSSFATLRSLTLFLSITTPTHSFRDFFVSSNNYSLGGSWLIGWDRRVFRESFADSLTRDCVWGFPPLPGLEIPCVSILLPSTHVAKASLLAKTTEHILNGWQRAPGSRPRPIRFVLEEHWRFFVGLLSALPRDLKKRLIFFLCRM